MKNLPPLGPILEQTEKSEMAGTGTLNSNYQTPGVPENVVFSSSFGNLETSGGVERSGTFRDYRGTTLPK